MKAAPDSNGQGVDEDAVNRLADYALAHGVNYFDTAPPYRQSCRREPRVLPSAGPPRPVSHRREDVQPPPLWSGTSRQGAA